MKHNLKNAIVYVNQRIDFLDNPQRWFVDYTKLEGGKSRVLTDEFDNISEAMTRKMDLDRVLGKELLPVANF